ncbi:MAG: L,D-transpeptidase family protein [Ignavibacteriales bacterium]|nr:L,D-transpeptidase family protein [Ignavibacteriales bacterium]
MKKTASLLLILLYSFHWFGCGDKTTSEEPEITKPVSAAIASYWQTVTFNFQVDSSKMWCRDTLRFFYQKTANTPVFLRSASDSLEIASVIKILHNSYQHGIQPERYSTRILDSLYHICASQWRLLPLKTPSAFAEFDVKLAMASILYIYDMKRGLINPYDIDSSDYTIPLPNSRIDLQEFLSSKTKSKFLADVQPKNEQYKTMQTWLLKYQILKESGKWVKVPAIDGKVEKGKKSLILKSVADNLKMLDFLEPGYKIDTSFVYDSILFNAVKRFQMKNGIPDDGVIGKFTIEQMNITPEKKIELLQLNMERLRHNPFVDSSNYLLVNLPEYKLFLRRDGRTQKDIRICCGQKRERYYFEKFKVYARTKRWKDKPKNFETPQVYSRVYVMVTNPTWGVPMSIAKNETIHDIHKDSMFFKKRGFKVYKGGKQIDPATIAWKNYSPSNLPFNFVQDPGAGNALGKIKFLFMNSFSIYLHDTPTRGPFGQSVRAVSHGCVRVEKPMELAAFLLQDNRSFSLDDVKCEIGIKPEDESKLARYKELLGRKPKLHEFRLDKTFPVFIIYLTARPVESGEVIFRADVYGKDQKLKELMHSKMRPLI